LTCRDDRQTCCSPRATCRLWTSSPRRTNCWKVCSRHFIRQIHRHNPTYCVGLIAVLFKCDPATMIGRGHMYRSLWCASIGPFIACSVSVAQEPFPKIELKAEVLSNSQVRLTWKSPPSDPEFVIERLRPDSAEKPSVLAVLWLSGVPGWGPMTNRDQS
jgi:hypothetical protein